MVFHSFLDFSHKFVPPFRRFRSGGGVDTRRDTRRHWVVVQFLQGGTATFNSKSVQIWRVPFASGDGDAGDGVERSLFCKSVSFKTELAGYKATVYDLVGGQIRPYFFVFAFGAG